jgi:CDP-glycerol glycerophosphotransferase
MFLTFQGDYTCNPKYIAEEMLRRGTDARLVWDVKTAIPRSDYPIELEFVYHNSYDFYKELAASKVVIENTNIVERLRAYKKKDQYLLQTWHGSLGIKRLDGDVVMGYSWKRLAKKCQKTVDILLSNSEFESEVFRTAYWNNVPAKLVGHARNDIFFLADEEQKRKIRKKVYRFLDIEEDRKIFLFAPTHRDDVDESYEPLNYESVKNALEDRFGGHWQIVIRLHNRLKKESTVWLRDLPEYVSNATLYEDMQELLLCTDVGVTDYSSWIFDYVLSRKPGFVIELGLEDFKESRGFYYPIETTPFPIAKDSEELAQQIRAFDDEKYQKDIDRFLEERGCMEDGKASARIADLVDDLIKR